MKRHQIDNNILKGCDCVMRYVIEQVRKKENRQLQSVIRMEIDYELVTLYDAMQANDTIEIIKSKEKLRALVHKLHGLTEYV